MYFILFSVCLVLHLFLFSPSFNQHILQSNTLVHLLISLSTIFSTIHSIIYSIIHVGWGVDGEQELCREGELKLGIRLRYL